MPLPSSQHSAARCPFCGKTEGEAVKTKAQEISDRLRTFQCCSCKRAWEPTGVSGFVEVPSAYLSAKPSA